VKIVWGNFYWGKQTGGVKSSNLNGDGNPEVLFAAGSYSRSPMKKATGAACLCHAHNSLQLLPLPAHHHLHRLRFVKYLRL
jgi:hypothetical protein